MSDTHEQLKLLFSVYLLECEKFEDKGRFVSYLKPIPVYIVIHENLGLLGTAKKLRQM